MRPSNVKNLQAKIILLSSEFARLEQKRDELLARRPGLPTTNRIELLREVVSIMASMKSTERPL